MSTVKKFKLTFTDRKSGKTIQNAEPTRMVTADGKFQSLAIWNSENEPTILASIPIDEPEQSLWNTAKQKMLV